mgnify:CR=1 FL=1|tara:strand:- start:5249 stop:6301 length:1053 start_codon:yes stop_codon:yes gene_type:complete
MKNNKFKIIKFYFNYLIYIIFLSFIFSYSYKGQLWLDTNFLENSEDLSYFGYIAELSLRSNDNLDFEWSRKLTSKYSNSETFNINQNYRLWIRYSKPKYDFRLGLQKISFGAASLLRPLNWFDTIDFTSTTDQTDGIKAMRAQFFPSESTIFWIWCLDDEKVSCGSRLEFLNSLGSFGLSYHNDRNNTSHEVFKAPQIIENQPFMFPGKNHRIGIDYRYDGLMGLWLEGSSILSSSKDINLNRFDMLTLGADYTFPILNGLLISSESMYFSIISQDLWILNQTTSSLIASMPIGMLNDLMFITIRDWDTKDFYNLLRWSTTFDYFSINCMLSINPSEVQDNFKIMFIYNH